MRIFTHLILAAAVTATAPNPLRAGELPGALGYTLFVDGVRVGHSSMTITTERDALVFESKTRVTLGPNVIDLTSRTEADAETFRVRRFAFDGTKGGMPVAARVVLVGDSANGWVQSAGSDERRSRSQHHEGGFVPFEDWVMDLEVLLALRQAKAEGTGQYRVLFANSFLTADLLAGFTGEASVESAERSLVARRMEVFLAGGAPFFSHVDPKDGIPVYLHFPGTRAEAFRDDFFGDKPASRYPAGGSARTGP